MKMVLIYKYVDDQAARSQILMIVEINAPESCHQYKNFIFLQKKHKENFFEC